MENKFRFNVKTLLLALPMLLMTAFALTKGKWPQDWHHRMAFILTYAAFNAAFLLTLITGKIDRWRLILYVAVAFFFIISVLGNMNEIYGSPPLPDFEFRLNTPLCPVVIPFLLIPAALTKTVIWPGALTDSFASITFIFIMWLGASISLGRGFCSWVCFWGGADDLFSRLLPKPVIKKMPGWCKDLPFAILLVFVLLSTLWLVPVYCAWLCPVKPLAELPAERFVRDMSMWGFHLALFITIVVILPILTKKRTHCAYFCPLGVLQRSAEFINSFNLRIDAEKCVKCGTCINSCNVSAVSEELRDKGQREKTCTKCGRCIDRCPTGAIHFHVKGTGTDSNRILSKMLFIYSAFGFLAMFGGSICMDGIYRIILFITTGSFSQ
ncbi:MAG: 4Fe-4S binding protein [Elusimicrobia bacterium]|nr:4Fe-4S binding protein [Elusimicrobiota bacterium]